MRTGPATLETTLPSAASLGSRTDTALRRPLEGMLGVPFTTGNTVDVLRNGDRAFPAMLDAIATSTSNVDLLWFLWGHGEITDLFTGALAERARAGVRVRVLLDGFGARGISRTQVQHRDRPGVDR